VSQPTSTHIAWRFLRQQKCRFLAALCWRALFVIVPMQVPVLTGAIVDGLTHEDMVVYGVRVRSGDATGLPGALFLGLWFVALAYGASAYGQMMASHRLSRNFVSALRKAVARTALYLGLDRFQRYGTGDLMDRTLIDTANLRRFMERVCVQTLINVLRIAYPIGMLVVIDPMLTVIALSVLPPQILITRRLQRHLHAATKKSRQSHSELTSDVKESLDGVETIQVLSAEGPCADRILRDADVLESDELCASRYSAAISGTVFFMTSLGIALTWWQGSQRVLSGQMTLGALILFTGFVAFAYQPFRQFTTMLTTYRRGLVSLDRIGELLAGCPPTTARSSGRPLRIESGTIEFQHVSFGYGRRRVLKGVDLRIEPRRLTVVIGRSGSGKSSLLRLISRLYDPQGGAVCVDGQDLRCVSLQSLRAQVAAVPQQPVLFRGTIRRNICLARPDARPHEVVAACEAAGAMEFIGRLPDGLETRLGRDGVRLSGGQAQRVSIARALLPQPRVILLDEPTSALDAESETAIVESLRRLRCRATIVVVGHRARTIHSADRVVVMDAGRVVAHGSRAAVGSNSPLLSELVPAPLVEAA